MVTKCNSLSYNWICLIISILLFVCLFALCFVFMLFGFFAVLAICCCAQLVIVFVSSCSQCECVYIPLSVIPTVLVLTAMDCTIVGSVLLFARLFVHFFSLSFALLAQLLFAWDIDVWSFPSSIWTNWMAMSRSICSFVKSERE